MFIFLSGCNLSVDLPEQVQQIPMPEILIVESVDVFTGLSDSLLQNMDVYIQAGRIQNMIQTGAAMPENAMRIDGRGKTLLPGLIDMHVHVGGAEAAPWDLFIVEPEAHLDMWLAAGITTVADMGGNPSVLQDMKAKQRSAEITGPRIFMPGSSPITVSEGHPIAALKSILPFPLGAVLARQFSTVDSPKDAKAVVESTLSYNPDFVKVIYDKIPDDSPQLSLDGLKAIVDSAHEHQLPVYAHIGTAQDAVEAIQAGVDVLAHGIYQGDMSEEELNMIVESKVPIVYTAWAFEATAQTAEGDLSASKMDKKLAPKRAVDSALGQKGAQVLDQKVMGQMARTCSENRNKRQSHIKRLYEAGAPILVGSDSPFFGIWAGASLHHELEELVASGLSPADALKGATSLAAKTLDPASDFGTVEVGQRAELILVEGNPLTDISNTQRLTHVIQGTKIQYMLD